ncbi:MAG: hypothetical protein Q4E24_16150 [bacterium]|nr:hypothetical protein [bacterium]
MLINITERDFVCANCQHFSQHYIKCGSSYHECYSGHCSYPRNKIREPGHPACVNFEQGGKKGFWHV